MVLSPPRLSASGWVVVTLIAAYIMALSAVTIHRYQTYGAFGDLATFEQITWNSLRGNVFGTTYGASIFPYWSMVLDHIAVPVSPDSSYLEGHLEPGLLLLLPIYAAWSRTETLLVLQSLALGLAAVPIYLSAKRTVSPLLGALAAAGFLLSPALTGINMVDFHGQAFATLWIGAAVYAIRADHVRRYVLFYLLALATNEVACVTLCALGLYMLVFTRHRGLGAGSIVVGAAYFLFATRFLIPFFAPTADYPFAGYFSHWGGSPVEFLHTLITRPGEVLGFIAGPEQVNYVGALLLPVLFLSLLAPDVLVIAAPVLGANLLADSSAQRLMYGHYNASLLPIIYIAAAIGLGRLLAFVRPRISRTNDDASRRFRMATAAVFVAFTVVMNSQISNWPVTRALGWNSFVAPANLHSLDEAVALVPDGASVSTTDAIATHLARRRLLFLFPVNAEDSDYLVLPKDDQMSRIWPLTSEQLNSYTHALIASGAFRVILDENDIMVLRRSATVPLRLEVSAIEDTDAAARYTGEWQAIQDPASSGGSLHVSGQPGATVEADFDGSRILFVYRRCLDCGVAIVRIDGAVVATVDTSGPPAARRYHLSRVSEGRHHVLVTVDPTRSVFSTGTRVYFDAFLQAAK